MSKIFVCHGIWQEFKKFRNRKTGREYRFGKCEECRKHFYLNSLEEIEEGRPAKNFFKKLRPDLVEIKPTIIYLKTLCCAYPARKTKRTGSVKRKNFKKVTTEYQVRKEIKYNQTVEEINNSNHNSYEHSGDLAACL